MNDTIQFIAIAGFGAICQEYLHWYGLRRSINSKENKKILTSKLYWLLVFGMTIITGIACYILFYDSEHNDNLKVPFLFGAAFPSLFKNIVSAVFSKQQHLGVGNLEKLKTQDIIDIYFQL